MAEGYIYIYGTEMARKKEQKKGAKPVSFFCSRPPVTFPRTLFSFSFFFLKPVLSPEVLEPNITYASANETSLSATRHGRNASQCETKSRREHVYLQKRFLNILSLLSSFRRVEMIKNAGEKRKSINFRYQTGVNR